MNASKSAMIGLAAVLLAAIGYAIYLYQGPLKRISSENEKLAAEIAQLKSSSENMNADYKVQLDEKIRLAETLEGKIAQLEGTLARINKEKQATQSELEALVSQVRKEKESVEAELQSRIADLENQLAAKARELKNSRSESQQFKAALEEIKTDHKTELAEKIRLVEELQTKISKLEEAVARTKNETQIIKEDLRATIKRLQDQLAQRELELQNPAAKCSSCKKPRQKRYPPIKPSSPIKFSS